MPDLSDQIKTVADQAGQATDAESWDAAMKDASKSVPEAAQFVGRYSPLLQQRVHALKDHNFAFDRPVTDK
jgi:hypothetical protein